MRFLREKVQEAVEELLGDKFGDDWKVLDSFLSHFHTRIISQGQNLQSNELLAELLAKAFTHATEELDSNNSIILITIIMSHLDHVLQHEVPSILII